MVTSIKRLLVGNPLKTEQAAHERLSKKTALAVFSSDALSSTAYAKDGSISYLKLARDTSMPVALVAQILDAHSLHRTAATVPPGQLMTFPRKIKKDEDPENVI